MKKFIVRAILLSFINVSGFGLVDAFAQPVVPCSGDTCDPGDANADGFVNLADLGVIINIFRGNQTGPGNGDCNGDTFTNLADLGCVINKFRGPPSGPTPTPSPSSCPPGEKECTISCIPIEAGCCGDGTFCPAPNPVCCPPCWGILCTQRFGMSWYVGGVECYYQDIEVAP